VRHRIAAILLSGAVLTGCVAREAPAPGRQVAPVRVQPSPSGVRTGLDLVIGRDARALAAAFGTPDLDIREGRARKLQFLGPACVLDVYLYPSRTGAEPVATHVDARLPDGRDMDRASCIAAISRR